MNLTIYIFLAISFFPTVANGWEKVFDYRDHDYRPPYIDAIYGFSADDNGRMIVCIEDTPGLRIMLSEDDGETWTQETSGFWNFKMGTPSPRPFSLTTSWILDNRYIYSTYDGSSTGGGIESSIKIYDIESGWIDTVMLKSQQKMTGLYMRDTVVGYAFSNDTLKITKDGWKTFKNDRYFDSRTYYYTGLHSNDTIMTISADRADGVHRLRKRHFDDSLWIGHKEVPIDAVIKSAFFMDDGNTGWVIAARSTDIGNTREHVIMKTEDAGNSWKIQLDTASGGFNLNSVKFVNEDVGIVTGASNIAYTTYNGGDNWEMERIPDESSSFYMFAEISEKYIYIYTHLGKVFRRPIYPSTVEESNIEESLIYPNPANDILYVSKELADDDFIIMTMDGRKAVEGMINNTGHPNILISHLDRGVYLLYIDGKMMKFIKS